MIAALMIVFGSGGGAGLPLAHFESVEACQQAVLSMPSKAEVPRNEGWAYRSLYYACIPYTVGTMSKSTMEGAR